MLSTQITRLGPASWREDDINSSLSLNRLRARQAEGNSPAAYASRRTLIPRSSCGFAFFKPLCTVLPTPCCATPLVLLKRLHAWHPVRFGCESEDGISDGSHVDEEDA